jgi:beta-glucanase (GH16 family)
VTIDYNTQDGTAISSSDYTAVIGQTLTFQPNETSKQITVTVNGDVVKETDEQFTVVLSNAKNATLVKSTAVGTIQNDDAGTATLVWSDEFNGNSLNQNDWSYEIGDGCSINLCGWGNNELEYYTDRPENLYFQNGNMVIEARKESFSGRNYTSAKIVTRGKRTFKFGRMDIRAKLPKGKGIWPAIWMLPQNSVYGGWPKSGEIDIMEMLGHEPNKVYGTAHFGPGPGSTQFGRNYTLPSGDFSDNFHVFSINWDRNTIQWLVDGTVFSTFTNADANGATYPFNEDFYFILNLAVGGNWPGSPDATTAFPQQMLVDYIRVYQ